MNQSEARVHDLPIMQFGLERLLCLLVVTKERAEKEFELQKQSS